MEIAASWPWPEAMGCSPPRSSSALMSSCFGGHRVEGLGDLDVVVPMDLRSRVDRQVVALRRRRSQHWGLLDTEHLRRTGPDLDTKDFAVTVAGHAGSHYHRLGHDPASGAGLDVGGVEEHVGEFDVVQRPVPERREGHTELSADPGHLGLADPRCCTQRGDEVIDLAGRDPMDVGLHHHRVEGGIDLTAPIEDGREEAAMAELRNRQVHIPGLRRQQAGPAAVALVGSRVGPLMLPATLNEDGGDKLGEDGAARMLTLSSWRSSWCRSLVLCAGARRERGVATDQARSACRVDVAATTAAPRRAGPQSATGSAPGRTGAPAQRPLGRRR